MKRRILCVSAVMVCLVVAARLEASMIDTTTSGDWIGVYGQDGYILNGYIGVGWSLADKAKDLTSLPSYVSNYAYVGGTNMAYVPGNQYVGPTAATLAAALQDPRDPTGARKVGFVYCSPGEAFTVSLYLEADAPAFQLAVYALDGATTTTPWGGRGDDITAKWLGEPTPFDSATLTFTDVIGKWAVFDVDPQGRTQLDVTFAIAPAATRQEAMLNGMMFTTVPEPGTIALLATGLIGLLCYAWRKRR